MIVNITDKSINKFAQKVFIWAIENGLFLKLKEKMKTVESRDNNDNRTIEYKIDEIGSSTLIRVFSEEATDEELKSGEVKRFFDENILLKEYFIEENFNFFYLSNQWTEKTSNLSLTSFVNLINEIIESNYSCYYSKINHLDEQFVFNIIDVMPEKNNLENVLIEPKEILKQKEIKKYSFSELQDKFIFRLRTQNRPFSTQSKFSFHPPLFYKLNKEKMISWCTKQVDKLLIHTKEGQIINLKLINEINFKEIGVYFKLMNSNNEEELFFKYKNELLSHSQYTNQIKFLTLDHIEPISKIFIRLEKHLPIIKKISILTGENFGTQAKLDNKEIDLIISLLSKNDKIEIWDELEILEKNIQLEFLPSKLNKSKSNH